MENLPRSGLGAPGEVCFSFLERGGEFESSRLPKTAKTAVFASLVRYFYFTPPNSSSLSQLFLFLSKACSLCTKIPHQSAGFLLASRLSTKLGPRWETRTPGLMVPNHPRYQLRQSRIFIFQLRSNMWSTPIFDQLPARGKRRRPVCPEVFRAFRVRGFESRASCSQSRRAASCAAPRCSFINSAGPSNPFSRM